MKANGAKENLFMQGRQAYKSAYLCSVGAYVAYQTEAHLRFTNTFTIK